MRPNLDSLSEEIAQYLEAEHFIVFRSLSRTAEEDQFIYWDARRHPDYKQFLDCALQLGVRLIHFNAREFSAFHREDALEQLEEVELSREEKREMARRIEELRIYEGLTCAVELSFDFEGRIYLFELQTEWYEEWHEILDEIEAALPGGGGEGGSYGGYYSNN
jgi:hypothetical protein